MRSASSLCAGDMLGGLTMANVHAEARIIASTVSRAGPESKNGAAELSLNCIARKRIHDAVIDNGAVAAAAAALCLVCTAGPADAGTAIGG